MSSNYFPYENYNFSTYPYDPKFYNPPPVYESMPNEFLPVALERPKVIISLKSEHSSFNRFQWYVMTLHFKDEQGVSALTERQIRFDDQIAFYDRRKTIQDYRYNDNAIVLNIEGVCASTGDVIEKCERCCEKDKNNTISKRKKGGNVWSEDDDFNNAKLIQVVVNRNEDVDKNGVLKFRLRIGCCVGVNKQHHVNHKCAADGQLTVHKGCDGIRLKVTALLPVRSQTIFTESDPIRILGKIKKSAPAKKKRKVSQQTYETTEERLELSRASKFYSVLEEGFSIDPSLLLHRFATSYHQKMGDLFGSPYPELFDPEFFTEKNLALIDPKSPLMVQILTTVACGACCFDFKVTENLFNEAVKIIPEAALRQESFTDIILFTDGIDKLAMYYGARGDFDKARYYTSQGTLTLSSLVEHGYFDLGESSIYENNLWCKAMYFMDFHSLDTSLRWAISQGKSETVAFISHVLIFSFLIPDLKYFLFTQEWEDRKASMPADRSTIPIQKIIELVTTLKYAMLITKGYNETEHSELITCGLNSLIYFLSGNIIESGRCVTKVAIKCALKRHNSLISWVSILVTAFVGYHLSLEDISRVDEMELILKSLSGNCIFKWARFFPDFIAHCMNLDIPEPEPLGLPFGSKDIDDFSTCGGFHSLITYKTK